MSSVMIHYTNNLEHSCRITFEKSVTTFDFINNFFLSLDQFEDWGLWAWNEDSSNGGFEGSKQERLNQIDNIDSYNQNGTIVHIFTGATKIILTIDNNKELVEKLFAKLRTEAEFVKPKTKVEEQIKNNKDTQ